MLSKEFDMALVGNNILSSIMSFHLLKQNHSVLLLDDSRMGLGEMFNYLGEVEKNFIAHWAEDFQLSFFKNYESYIVKKTYSFSWHNTFIKLGGSPCENLRELCRKFPVIFDQNFLEEELPVILSTPEEFDKEFFSLCLKISKEAARFQRGHAGFDLQSFSVKGRKFLEKVFEQVTSVYMSQQKLSDEQLYDLRGFLYLGRVFHHERLSFHLSKVELMHLIVRLLSPCYLIDHDKLVKDAVREFTERGGEFKKTQVRDWLFHKNSPWSIELSSFDGIVHPKHMCFLGVKSIDMPIKTKHSLSCYRGIDTCVPLNEKIERPSDMIMFSGVEKIGKFSPVTILFFEEDQIRFKCLIEDRPGNKIDFFKKGLIKDLKKLVESFDPHVKLSWDSASFCETNDLWIDDHFGVKSKKNADLVYPEVVKVFDRNRPKSSRPLKKVHYYGPVTNGPLGLLSSFMEIKELNIKSL